MSEKRLPMGRTFNCNHGFFELPSEIYEVTISEDALTFDCEDAIYEITPGIGLKIRKKELSQ